ncbi:KICSTOR complex protein C12orf66 like [Dissostichus eleginoides]|uniref:KICSTOR complex protein C12orf66 like n=1 Tax=Dissostichus eleginoides TaxID=100907 RepID=A0AAD9CT30_DISEL|nr:KICSTOR complex protein C12orf66 like [Dissostichus eleginoides]
MSEVEELRPVPRERAILESFFTQLGMFSFDRAKDYVEKEKDSSSRSGGAVWASLLGALGHLAAAEKAYHNMTFLGQKMGGQSFFSRKDSIRSLYTSLYNELRKVVSGGRHGAPGSASYLEDLLSHLSEQLCHFTQARMDLSELYEKLHALSGQKSVNSEELLSSMQAVSSKYCSNFFAARLRFPSGVSFPLCSVSTAPTPMLAWGQLFQRQKETRKHMFGGQSQKAVQPPHLYLWLQRFQVLLLAKFSFYFHEALSRQTAAGDMKALTARTVPDFSGKICSFIRKHRQQRVAGVRQQRLRELPGTRVPSPSLVPSSHRRFPAGISGSLRNTKPFSSLKPGSKG